MESTDSIPESADYITDAVFFFIVGRLPISNMFNILNPMESADGNRPTGIGRRESADGNRPTIAVGRREISPVGTGLILSQQAIHNHLFWGRNIFTLHKCIFIAFPNANAIHLCPSPDIPMLNVFLGIPKSILYDRWLAVMYTPGEKDRFVTSLYVGIGGYDMFWGKE